MFHKAILEQHPFLAHGVILSPIFLSYAFGLWSPVAYAFLCLPGPFFWDIIPMGILAAAPLLKLWMTPLGIMVHFLSPHRHLPSGKKPLAHLSPSFTRFFLVGMALSCLLWIGKAAAEGFWFDSLLATKNRVVLMANLGLILWSRVTWKNKIVLLALVLLSTFLLGARTALLGFFVGLVAYYGLLWRRKLMTSLMVVGIYVWGGASLFLSFSWIETLSWIQPILHRWPTFEIRFAVWKTVQNWGQSHFWLGVGLDTLFKELRKLAQIFPGYPIHPHNIFLELQASFGIGGPLLLGAFTLFLARQTWRGHFPPIMLATFSYGMVLMMGYLSFFKDSWFVVWNLFSLQILNQSQQQKSR